MDQTSRIKLHTGNEMPILGLGTWELTENTADAINNALRLGYPMIDTSGDYGTQAGIGEGIRKNGIGRNALFLVTKVEETDDAYEAVRKNLDELGLDYADLVLIHRPPGSSAGEELWRGLIRARKEGLARDIGVSNYSSSLIDSLIEETGEVPVVNQVEWSPFGHHMAFKHHHDAHGIVIQAYSPLTRTRRLDDANLARIGQKHNKTPAQILIRWNLQRGSVPLPKANRWSHMEENLAVFDFALDEQELKTLDNLNEHYSALGKLPYV